MVTVYVAQGYCQQAGRVLENADGRAGEVRVRLRCLPSTEKAGRFDLARIGANARRAAEDSTTVAYIGEPEPHASLYAAPILEAANIAQLSNEIGSRAMHRVLSAIEGAGTGSGSIRESVLDELD